ncbi:universal stress protein [Amphritea japonica]|uniref:Universal stress protein n=1 Tax=Amphritea japonica ATCC BAA-1530 TaxID=1278309 RepID=A0A7R6SU62_9GAMM|nr:universal stress protein [Amphritea japonica]BBB27362.1 universal stress protein [Amphritea japonica ATCC BAA-1530]
MNNIVVATNFSPLSEKLIDLARVLSSTVYLLHVVLPNEDISYRDKKEIGQEFAEESSALNQQAQQFRDQGIETHALLLEGIATVAILEEADRLNADLIVLGGAGQSSSTLLGDDLVHKVVKQSQRAVLVLP